MFSSILIPAFEFESIRKIELSISGGLENDELQKYAKRYYSSTTDSEANLSVMSKHLLDSGTDPSSISPSILSSISSMGAVIDIVSLQMPSISNNFIGVSLYCDGNGSAKGYRPNIRSTNLVQACGHKNIVVLGDAFIGRYFDKEPEEWIRLDIEPEEISIESEWVKICALENSHQNLSKFTTSGQIQQLIQPEVTGIGSRSEGIPWTQTEDEVEIQIPIPESIKAKDILIVIKSTSLFVSTGVSDGGEEGGDGVARLRAPGGAALFGQVSPDESTWSKEGGWVTLSLAKKNSLNWLTLLK